MAVRMVHLPSSQASFSRCIYYCDTVSDRPAASTCNTGDLAIIQSGGNNSQLYIVATDLGPTNNWYGIPFNRGDLRSTGDPSLPEVSGIRTYPVATPSADGFLKIDTSLILVDIIGFGATANKVAEGNDKRFLTGVECAREQRVFGSDLVTNGTFLLIDSTAYFVYLGRTTKAITIKHVELLVTTAASGTPTNEVGIFSTPNPPNKSGQTLTKLWSDATLDALTGTGVKRNTNANATSIAAGTHIWAGIRTAFTGGGSNEPTLRALQDDWGEGHILTLASAGTFAATSTFAGVIPTAATQITCPALRAVLD